SSRHLFVCVRICGTLPKGRMIDKLIGVEGVGQTLDVNATTGGDTDSGPSQPLGVRRDENRPRPRRLLETSGDVRRQADRAVVPSQVATDGSDDHLTGSDADANLDLSVPS